MAGSPRAIGKRITTTHNRTREDARTTLCALSSCLYIRKGKSNTSNKDKAGKTRKENKQKTTGAKQEKERQRTKRKANKEITGQNGAKVKIYLPAFVFCREFGRPKGAKSEDIFGMWDKVVQDVRALAALAILLTLAKLS